MKPSSLVEKIRSERQKEVDQIDPSVQSLVDESVSQSLEEDSNRIIEELQTPDKDESEEN